MPKRLTPAGQAAPPVEPIVTGATLPPKPAPKRQPKPKPGSNVKYVRNLHHILTRVTLTTGRELLLHPRGQREDVDIVTKEEREDPKFLANVDLLFEVIDAATAQEIIAKQQTNARTQEHPLWQHLRNEQGKPYDQRVARIEEVFEKQGYVVGQIEETGAGRYTEKNHEVRRGVTPHYVEAPGSANHPATAYMQSVPGEISPEEYHEFLLWKQFKAQMEAARATPEAVRDSLSVSIEPVETDES